MSKYVEEPSKITAFIDVWIVPRSAHLSSWYLCAISMLLFIFWQQFRVQFAWIIEHVWTELLFRFDNWFSRCAVLVCSGLLAISPIRCTYNSVAIFECASVWESCLNNRSIIFWTNLTFHERFEWNMNGAEKMWIACACNLSRRTNGGALEIQTENAIKPLPLPRQSKPNQTQRKMLIMWWSRKQNCSHSRAQTPIH